MGDQVTKSIIVKGSVDELFDIWANFENFPQFMKYIKSVQKTGDQTSHWVMEGPLNKRLEWDAKTTTFERNKRIAWSSTQGDLKTSGQVTFNPLPNNSTEVTVLMHYEAPAGLVGKVVAELFSDPEKRMTEDLHNFKAYAEGMYERTAKAK
jgi:uncharacterized membrane protein